MWPGAEEVASAAKAHGLVLIAGAGVSMPAPTALPGWNDFNDIVLAAIGRRVSQATQNNVDGAGVVDALKKCRDEMGGFPPDFQAQLMEDECDVDYFRVLQILDFDVRNGCHEAIAATGHLRAVITTNFDRLIELALEAHGTPHETFFTEKHFETLANRPPGVVPIIKVHGSVQSPKSMVDTLRQRLQGRPAPLQPALAALFANHAVLTVGFSGGDLSYEPEYLGLRAGAPRSSLFAVMKRPGDKLNPALSDLLEKCGPVGKPIDGTLPESFIDLATVLGAAVRHVAPGGDVEALRAGRVSQLTERADAWVASLGHLTAVNIIAALTEARSSRGGYEILHQTRRHGLGVTTTAAPGYWRFQVNFGRHLLERGYNGNDLTAEQCEEELNRGQLDHIEPDDGFRILLRAAYRGERLDAKAHLALGHFHRGECDRAVKSAEDFAKEALKEGFSMYIMDGVLALGLVAAQTGQWKALIEWCEAVYPYVRRVGDEPRRARLCAVLGRALAFKQRDDEAERYLAEGTRIGERLRLGLVLAAVRAAAGYFEWERGNFENSASLLTWAANTLGRAEQRATCLPVLLDLAPVALKIGNEELCLQSLGKVRAELDRFPGYVPRYHQRVGHVLVEMGRLDDAREALGLLRASGEATRNPWAPAAAQGLEQKINSAAVT
jgi:hypothetical protein